MKDHIISHQKDPVQLEKLYRSNKGTFKKEFNSVYPRLQNSPLAEFWKERLNYESVEINRGSGRELSFVLLVSLVAGFIAKLPAIFEIDKDFFYPRNIGFIVFPMLAAYFAWKNKLSAGKIGVIVVTFLTGVIFINSLPDVRESDTLILSCIHLLLFLWAILGFAYVDGKSGNIDKRLGFLKYNGDLLVISALICIASGIMTGITIGLFSLLGINIE